MQKYYSVCLSELMLILWTESLCSLGQVTFHSCAQIPPTVQGLAHDTEALYLKCIDVCVVDYILYILIVCCTGLSLFIAIIYIGQLKVLLFSKYMS